MVPELPMRLVLAVFMFLAAFGCTANGPLLTGERRVMQPPAPELVEQDMQAILSGMARARARRAGI